MFGPSPCPSSSPGTCYSCECAFPTATPTSLAPTLSPQPTALLSTEVTLTGAAWSAARKCTATAAAAAIAMFVLLVYGR